MTGGMDGFASLFLEVGGIVVAMWAALWLIARRGRTPGAAWGSRDCQVVRQLAVGPRERVIVVRIRRQAAGAWCRLGIGVVDLRA